MRNNLLKSIIVFLVFFLNFESTVFAQAAFKFDQLNSKLTATTMRSGGPVAVIDWNNDGLDDIVRLNQGNTVIVEVQRTNQAFQTINLGNFGQGSGWAWAMCLADVDKNGFLDIIAGGYGPAVKIMKTSNDGQTGVVSNLPSSNFFLQNLSYGDFNNDGWIDIFCCDDNNENKLYLNDGAGNLLLSNIIDFDVTPTDDSGNYGSVVTDFDNDGDLDLYIAKCRQSVTNPADGRRINVMFVNNGDGTYTERAADFNLNVGWQSWTASFGDIDNDGDFDLLLTNHDYQSQILENDGNNVYTDISESTGFNTSDITPIQSVFEDFDNDGFVDIMISGSGARIWKNNGDKTFTRINNVFSPNDMLSFATGDLNNDGKIDMFTSYGGIYTNPSSTTDDIFWLNNTSNINHFITLRLEGTVSNIDAIGTNAFIYGAWGVQRREVRAGESYGTSNSFKLHFGLGDASTIDSLVIRWPSGISQTILNPSIDQFLFVKEQECVSPQVQITSAGPMVLCEGQTLTLSAPNGFEYLWSTGETTQNISVNTEGEYGVRVSQIGNNCPSVSKTVNILASPDETPSIAANGKTLFCEGESVIIQGPANVNNPVWSNGQTGSTLTVTESGSYTLTIQGACANYTSSAIDVEVVSAGIPIVQNQTITSPQIVTLNANGQNLTWWDAPTGGNQIATGNSYTTPEPVTENQTFYLQPSTNYGGDIYSGGLANPSGNSQYSGDNTTNAVTLFNVIENCVLKSVTVHTDTPGERKIELRDANDILIDSLVVNITGIMTIDLNFNLTPGNDYKLGTNGATNLLIPGWGFVAPRLKRNSSGVNYPYNINDLVSITNSNYGSQFYYYFYDWKIESAITECVGNRYPVSIIYDNQIGINQVAEFNFQLSPNPAQQFVQINTNAKNPTLSIIDAIGRTVKTANLNDANNIININELPSGVYFVQLVSNGAKSTKKLIKQ